MDAGIVTSYGKDPAIVRGSGILYVQPNQLIFKKYDLSFWKLTSSWFNDLLPIIASMDMGWQTASGLEGGLVT